MGFVVNESDANDLILQLESSNRLHLLGMQQESTTKRGRPLRSISSAIITSMTHQHYHHNHHQRQQYYESVKILRASLLFLFEDIKLCGFKELSAEMTILCGLEKEFLRYDEIGVYLILNFVSARDLN